MILLELKLKFENPYLNLKESNCNTCSLNTTCFVWPTEWVYMCICVCIFNYLSVSNIREILHKIQTSNSSLKISKSSNPGPTRGPAICWSWVHSPFLSLPTIPYYSTLCSWCSISITCLAPVGTAVWSMTPVSTSSLGA